MIPHTGRVRTSAGLAAVGSPRRQRGRSEAPSQSRGLVHTLPVAPTLIAEMRRGTPCAALFVERTVRLMDRQLQGIVVLLFAGILLVFSVGYRRMRASADWAVRRRYPPALGRRTEGHAST